MKFIHKEQVLGVFNYVTNTNSFSDTEFIYSKQSNYGLSTVTITVVIPTDQLKELMK